MACCRDEWPEAYVIDDEIHHSIFWAVPQMGVPSGLIPTPASGCWACIERHGLYYQVLPHVLLQQHWQAR